MPRTLHGMVAGVAAALLSSLGSSPLRAAPSASVGSCTNAVVVERHYGQPQWSSSGRQVEEVYLALSDGQHLDGPAEMGTTGFFWDYTPGNKVGVCVEAIHPLRLRVNDRITGASFVVHPTDPRAHGS
jgi:hypothetical protein